jgi:hypothetical protein
VQCDWLAAVDGLLYDLQAERVRVELRRPIGIGADGSDMMDSSYFGYVCFWSVRLSVNPDESAQASHRGIGGIVFAIALFR